MSVRTNVIILTLASRSAGVVTRQELLDAGVSSSTIASRVRGGYLAHVWSGLYEVPEMTSEWTSHFRAVKSVPGAAVAGRSAVPFWGAPLRMRSEDPVHIVGPWDGSRTTMPGVALRRTRLCFADEVRYPVPGLPVLSAAQTLVDLAADPTIGRARLVDTVEKVTAAGHTIPAEVLRIIEMKQGRGVAGIPRLRRVIRELFDDEPVPASVLEYRFQRLVEHSALPRFSRQVRPPWYDGRRGTVDFAHIEAKLIVEVDGRDSHSARQAMAEDRRRDRIAAGHGWLVIRLTWDDVVDHPTATLEQVEAAFNARLGHLGH